MSELKAYHIPAEIVGGVVLAEAFDYYEKKQVDAAIAEKDAELAQWKDKFHDLDNSWNEQCKKIADLKAENESLKYSVAALDTDIAMMKRWRKVSEELPEKQEWVFVSDGKHRMLCKRVDGAWLFDGAWMPEEHGKIEYWMPLPKAPKEADK